MRVNGKPVAPRALADNAAVTGHEAENLDEHHTRIFNDALARWKDGSDMSESFKSWAMSEAAHERKFSPQRFFEVRRWQDHVTDTGEREHINNTHIPLFTRFLLEECPELQPWCELRKSSWDRLFPALSKGRGNGAV